MRELLRKLEEVQGHELSPAWTASIQPCKAPFRTIRRAISAATQYFSMSNTSIPGRRMLHAHNIQLVIVTENTICAVLGMPDLLAL